MDICALHFLVALYGFMGLFSVLPSQLYDFTLKNFPGLLHFIGVAEN